MLTESYYHDTRYPLSPDTLPQIWEKAAQRDTGNFVLWADPYEKMTHKQIYDQAMMIAKGLLNLGLKRGDTLCCFGCQGSDPILMFVACSSIGIKFTSHYIHFPIEKRIKAVISKVNPSAVLIGDVKLFSTAVSSKFTDLINELTNEESAHNELTNEESAHKIPRILYDRKLEKEAERLQHGWKSLSQVITQGRTEVSDNELNAAKALVQKNEPCFYTFSSGSTGEPKVVLIGAALFANAPVNCKTGFGGIVQVFGAQEVNADDCTAVSQLTECIACDANLVLFPFVTSTDDSDIIKSVLRAIDKHRIEIFHYDPYYITQLVNHPEYLLGYDLSCLRAINIVGSVTTQEFKERVLAIAPESVNIYGMSEFFIVGVGAPGGMKKLPTAVGQPLPNVEAKIVDDDGTIVPVNTRGQLCLRGWGMFLEYKDQPELTAKARDEDGWLLTGDLASMDDLGYLRIYGRIATAQRWKRYHNVVYSIAVETILSTHPMIRACMVTGTPAEGVIGHDINYVIVAAPGSGLTAGEVKEFAVAKMNNYLEWPKRVFFYHYDNLPMTSGARKKIDRAKLQEEITTRVECDPTEGVVWEDSEMLDVISQ